MLAGPSLNQLVRPQQDGLRDRQAERPGRTEVDEQLVPRRLFDRQICRLGAFQDAINVIRRPPEHVRITRAICDKPARLDEFLHLIHRWEPMFGGEIDQRFPMKSQDWRGDNVKCLRPGFRSDLKSLVEVTRTPNLQYLKVPAQRASCNLVRFEPQRRFPGVGASSADQDRDARAFGYDLAEQLHALSRQFGWERQSSNVASRLRKSGIEPGLLCRAADRHDDRNGFRRARRGLCRLGTLRDDDVHRAANHFGCQVWQVLQNVVRGVMLDDDILSLDVARVAKTFAKPLYSVRCQSRGARPEKPNPRDLRWLLGVVLRLNGKRPRNQTDNEDDREPDPPHGHLAWDGWRGV